MQNKNNQASLRNYLKIPIILPFVALLIQIIMYSEPYVTGPHFHNVSIIDMWDMFFHSCIRGTEHFIGMFTFLILFEITAFVPLLVLNKKPHLAIVLAIANALAVETVPFFWKGVFSTKGLEATTGYFGFLLANIIIIIGAYIARKNHSNHKKE